MSTGAPRTPEQTPQGEQKTQEQQPSAQRGIPRWIANARNVFLGRLNRSTQDARQPGEAAAALAGDTDTPPIVVRHEVAPSREWNINTASDFLIGSYRFSQGNENQQKNLGELAHRLHGELTIDTTLQAAVREKSRPRILRFLHAYQGTRDLRGGFNEGAAPWYHLLPTPLPDYTKETGPVGHKSITAQTIYKSIEEELAIMTMTLNGTHEFPPSDEEPTELQKTIQAQRVGELEKRRALPDNALIDRIIIDMMQADLNNMQGEGRHRTASGKGEQPPPIKQSHPMLDPYYSFSHDFLDDETHTTGSFVLDDVMARCRERYRDMVQGKVSREEIEDAFKYSGEKKNIKKYTDFEELRKDLQARFAETHQQN